MKGIGTLLAVGMTTAALALVGCGKGEEETASSGGQSSSGGQKTYVIGVIAKAQGNPVFKAARVGAQDAAEELGEKYGVEITIDWRTPNTEDAQQQAQFVEQLASQGVDGIAISCSDANLLTSAINDAVSRGVVVMTFDSDAPESDRMAYYGVDDMEAGAAVMQQLAEEMGGEGVVAVLTGNPNATNLQARVSGVQAEAGKYDGITIIDVYDNPGEGAAEAAAKMKAVQIANPQITGWALVGGWPLYTENALDGIYDKAKIVSLDPLPLPLAYLKKGQVQVLIGQPYHGWGYETVRMIMEKLIDKKDPPSEFVTSELEFVRSDRADEYIAKWNEWNK